MKYQHKLDVSDTNVGNKTEKSLTQDFSKEEKMFVATLYLVIITILSFKGDIGNIRINTFLAMIIILLASDIISICSRLDDLKRK